jgi:hypothetical protein
MASVYEEILQWSATLPFWEQLALDKVLGGVELIAGEENELLEQLLSDEGLAPVRPRPSLKYVAAPPQATPSTPLRIARAFGFRNVNALVPDQELVFSDQLTVFYGGNGSGKSGYARVLGALGFTRGDRRVLPDVTKAYDPSAKPQVSIELADGSAPSEFVIADRGSALPQLYVFDTTSVVSHLTEEHTISFSPAGLEVLTRLSAVTDRIRALLRERVLKASGPYVAQPAFVGDSEVARLVASLSATSDIQKLRVLASLSNEERVRAAFLDAEIARIKSTDARQRLQVLASQLTSARALTEDCRFLREELEELTPAALSKLASELAAADRAAAAVGAGQFATPNLRTVGTDPWIAFVRAAQAVAVNEGSVAQPYPAAAAVCVLCQQPLTPEARDLLQRLWAFLRGEAQQSARRLRERVEATTARLRRLQERVGRARLSVRHVYPDPTAVPAGVVQGFLDAANAAADFALGTLVSGSRAGHPALPGGEQRVLQEAIAKIAAEDAALRASDSTAQLTALAAELRLLEHRGQLSAQLDPIARYIDVAAWVKRATGAGGSTRHITATHNRIFEQQVTQRYVAMFSDTLAELGCPLMVEIDTRGRKGETLKQLALKADPSMPGALVAPDLVLSEGEKRAIALADFLTEVTLDSKSGTIVLDDPVTSLDFGWKEAVAPRLVRESKGRQVAVFTHDLHFLHLLVEAAASGGVAIAVHWIRRGDDSKAGYVFPNNAPSMERAFRSSQPARDIYAEAKAEATPGRRARLLREGFAALRTSYEAFVVFDLFNEVVLRWGERISIGRLKAVMVDPVICAEVDAAHARLSRFIEGHLHSDGTSPPLLEPSALLTEIDEFDALKKRHKAQLAAPKGKAS